MPHSHDHFDLSAHSAARQGESKRLLIAMLLTGGILVAEVVGGLLTNSLALVSDGGHMLSDLLSLGMALAALLIARRPPTDRRTFGFHRFEILAALGNGMLLTAVAVYIVVEAIARFRQPQPVDSLPMLAIAGIGLLANLGAMAALRHEHQSLNARGAFLHVLSDTLSSVGVIVGGIVMALTGLYVLDAVLSVLIAAVIARGAYRLGREAISILLESTPRHISLPALRETMLAVGEVQNVHDVHVWSITSGLYAMSAHVLVAEHECGNSGRTLRGLNDLLHSRFDISHTTLQIECPACCPDDHCVLEPLHGAS